MMLKLKFGKKFEINRIKNTFDKIEWYKYHNYKPIIPDCKNNIKEIENFVNENFNEKEYLENGEKLVKDFNKIKYDFIEKVANTIGKKLPKEIELIVTKYGVGGSYVLPNKVIINIKGNQINKPRLEVLKHELIHLILEDVVIKNGLSHKQKEDLIRKVENSLKSQDNQTSKLLKQHHTKLDRFRSASKVQEKLISS